MTTTMRTWTVTVPPRPFTVTLHNHDRELPPVGAFRRRAPTGYSTVTCSCGELNAAGRSTDMSFLGNVHALIHLWTQIGHVTDHG